MQQYDLAIIGGGPAGVAAGVYAARKRLNTIFITKDWNGQSSVSEGIENWIGEVKISGLDLSKKLENHLKAYAGDVLDIKEGEWVKNVESQKSKGKSEEVTSGAIGIDRGSLMSRFSRIVPGSTARVGEIFQQANQQIRPLGANVRAPEAIPSRSLENLFTITTNKDSYKAKTILVTTGSSRRKLDIPGADRLEHKGLTYCASCDGPLFAGQDVAVVGGGNAGFESASQLLAYCKSVTLLSRSDFKADPTTIEAVLNNPKMKAVKNAIPKEILGDKFVSALTYTDAVTKKDITLNVTGIFAEIGSIPNTDFLKEVIKLDQYNRIPVDPKNQRAGISGIWAAGDVTDGLFHQNNIAVGDAVKALEDIYLFLKAK
jgi:alkyl hydroperoxide reductase subunit F